MNEKNRHVRHRNFFADFLRDAGTSHPAATNRDGISPLSHSYTHYYGHANNYSHTANSYLYTNPHFIRV